MLAALPRKKLCVSVNQTSLSVQADASSSYLAPFAGGSTSAHAPAEQSLRASASPAARLPPTKPVPLTSSVLGYFNNMWKGSDVAATAEASARPAATAPRQLEAEIGEDSSGNFLDAEYKTATSDTASFLTAQGVPGRSNSSNSSL